MLDQRKSSRGGVSDTCDRAGLNQNTTANTQRTRGGPKPHKIHVTFPPPPILYPTEGTREKRCGKVEQSGYGGYRVSAIVVRLAHVVSPSCHVCFAAVRVRFYPSETWSRGTTSAKTSHDEIKLKFEGLVTPDFFWLSVPQKRVVPRNDEQVPEHRDGRTVGRSRNYRKTNNRTTTRIVELPRNFKGS